MPCFTCLVQLFQVLDPKCQKGRWAPAVMGACIGEMVTGLVELIDVGSRLLIRIK